MKVKINPNFGRWVDVSGSNEPSTPPTKPQNTFYEWVNSTENYINETSNFEHRSGLGLCMQLTMFGDLREGENEIVFDIPQTLPDGTNFYFLSGFIESPDNMQYTLSGNTNQITGYTTSGLFLAITPDNLINVGGKFGITFTAIDIRGGNPIIETIPRFKITINYLVAPIGGNN